MNSFNVKEDETKQNYCNICIVSFHIFHFCQRKTLTVSMHNPQPTSDIKRKEVKTNNYKVYEILNRIIDG